MENENTSFEYPVNPEETLSLPHFDEEETLQSARPVVPLHEVKGEERSKRRLLLGAALALAGILGATTASLVYSHRDQAENASSVETNGESAATDDADAPSGEVTGASLNSNEAASIPEPEKAVASSAKTSTASRVTARQTPKTADIPSHTERADSSETDPDRQETISIEEREARRDERREARRLRRDRRLERQSRDGMTRIREIFEGSPRP
jgi:hypothetical protein